MAIVSAIALLAFAPASVAQEAPATGSDVGSDVMDFLNGPGVPGPLAPLGKKLHAAGFTPKLNMIAVDINNLSEGEKTGKHESLMMFNVGLDTDLEKLIGLNGSTIHFNYLYVPGPHDNGNYFGSYGADSLVGNSGPFIPYVSHMNQFTWEQKLFGDRLDLEAGKSNPGNYFAKSLCNQPFVCQGISLQDGAGFAPPPYANLGARAAYKITPEVTAQGGYWRYNTAFPFSKGWEGWTGSVSTPAAFGSQYIVHPNVGMYFGNVTYETTYKTDRYPKYYELMFYHNDGKQIDMLTSKTHDGADGMYIGGRQTVWREAGESLAPRPTAVSVYGSLYASFDPNAGVPGAYSVQDEVDTGITLEGPFHSRPFDSYSVKFIWQHVSSHQQQFMKTFNTNYTVGPDEKAFGVDANFMLAGSVILSPWALYVLDPNALQATENGVSYNGNPKSGFAVGVNLVVLLDKMLGL
ncbi:carbohydrate porin [Telmatospirillum siberiense]|uniref:carbohydrate porin n=1 Tax=Telmatospirillum siberiense TaxID=382514 RepID=UPI0013041FB4|nr:carbohydrate porin [Telmatospirillum siberiense]